MPITTVTLPGRAAALWVGGARESGAILPGLETSDYLYRRSLDRRLYLPTGCVLPEVVPQRMTEEPAVILTGPRTVGKSTLLAALAAQFDRPVLDLFPASHDGTRC